MTTIESSGFLTEMTSYHTLKTSLVQLAIHIVSLTNPADNVTLERFCISEAYRALQTVDDLK